MNIVILSISQTMIDGMNKKYPNHGLSMDIPKDLYKSVPETKESGLRHQ